MYLIADAGSTKTAWRLFFGEEILMDFTSRGIHPLFMSVKEIEDEISKNVLPFLNPEKISKVYFFGAGCTTSSLQTKVYDAISIYFPESYVYVGSDLEAAALSLFGKERGVACIIGTGANSALWDGNKIVQSVPSLGYILGDEGSATWIGKQLILSYYRGTMPPSFKEMFEEFFSGDVDYILKNVYRGNAPNLFLASITEKFINNEDSFIDEILMKAAQIFFETFIKPFPEKEPIGIIGSIAKINEIRLISLAHANNRKIVRIDKNAIEGLHKFFLTD
jgi:N-acetylglucosamine kinase-like BadF-type ATPase